MGDTAFQTVDCLDPDSAAGPGNSEMLKKEFPGIR